MTLPAELRNRVYEELLATNRRISTSKRTAKKRCMTGILCTSKQIREEALPIYFGNNKIRVDIRALSETHISRKALWLSSIVEKYGCRPFLSLRFYVDLVAWQGLGNMLPLLEVIRRTGVSFDRDEAADTGEYYSCKGIIECSGNFSRLEEALGQALAIGRNAYERGWSKKQLKQRYDNFVELELSTGPGKAALKRQEERQKKLEQMKEKLRLSKEGIDAGGIGS